MKLFRKSLWLVLTGALFMSFSMVLIFTSPIPVESQLPNKLQILVKADRFYKQGNLDAAEKLYRQVKSAFRDGNISFPKGTNNLDKMEPAAQKLFKQSEDGIAQNLESKIFIPLQLLTNSYPEFIPGHLRLAESCEKDPKGCQRNANDEQPRNAIEVLERATTLYPEQTDLLFAKIKALEKEENFLEAAISSRQFALTYPHNPESNKFADLAEENQKRYQTKIREDLIGLGITNFIVSRILTKDPSATAIIMLLLQGESKFGEVVAEKYKQQLPLLQDQVVLDYINELGQKLAKLMGRDEFNYEFYVVKDNSINAFTLPGGKVFVNTGAILASQSQAELAGLLTHEISHAVLSHGFQRVVEMALVKNIIGGITNKLPKLSNQVIPFKDLITSIISLPYDREKERQADILGTRTLATSGYAADGLRNLMITLKQVTQKSLPAWTSTHPTPDQRVRYIEAIIKHNNYNRYAYEGVDEQIKIKNRVKQLIGDDHPGDNPPQDSTSGSSRTVGNVPLQVTQTHLDVEISVEGAYVESNGTYTVNFTIDNRSDHDFGFVPVFAEVLDANGSKISARYSLESGNNAVVAPGNKLKCRVMILGQSWNNSGGQNLTLLIKEASVGSRVFRIPI